MKTILLISSHLTDLEREGIRQALDRKSTQFLMLGIGTAEGAPVAQEDGSFLKDDQGAILVPYLDSPSLKALPTSLADAIAQRDWAIPTCAGSACLTVHAPCATTARPCAWTPGPIRVTGCCCPLLLLAACAGRRGWLFCLPLLFLLPQPSYAFDFEDIGCAPINGACICSGKAIRRRLRSI